MIYIDLENNPPSQNWIDRADLVTQQLIAAPNPLERNRIIDLNQPLWTELKLHLSSLYNDKCWYTESINPGAHCHVDHFRPKKEVIDEKGIKTEGYWWLAFDWMNYRFSGPASNVRKKSYFQVVSNRGFNYADNLNLEDILFLDPIKFRDPEELAFDNEGIVRPRESNKLLRNYKRARYSIHRLNLNSPSLIDKRKDKYRKAIILLLRIDKKLNLQSIIFDQAREVEIETDMRSLWVMCSKNSEFSAAVKYCLKSSGLDWAIDIVAKAA
ncbi:hypothetical protein C8C83_1731 [Flavobacterium sp. 90]|uniref:hypothetical protein n=1 Tax=unclassified Flavobacterium TaxID=196869 RepID=UPI000EAC549C|nr:MULTISPECIES: hypothetical protein [unclassified Flavobacterium]RKR10063.1 hypothetical protein C8C82_2033 [Flavobacterium sp. 81]TCK53848.1 hypothetical protein C8C83_1731 [Flavobacterium sp. 90]